MRRHQIPVESSDSPQINIVPMIDVIFSILAFFIMASLVLGRLEGLTVNLPKAATAKPQQSSRVTLTMDKQGMLYLNQSSVELEALANAIRQLTNPYESLIVVLNADGSVTHDRVVAVIDQIRQVPDAKLTIATRNH
jgi:biopolymer transport protein ExbD